VNTYIVVFGKEHWSAVLSLLHNRHRQHNHRPSDDQDPREPQQEDYSNLNQTYNCLYMYMYLLYEVSHIVDCIERVRVGVLIFGTFFRLNRYNHHISIDCGYWDGLMSFSMRCCGIKVGRKSISRVCQLCIVNRRLSNSALSPTLFFMVLT
jgi:hypothetical protein